MTPSSHGGKIRTPPHSDDGCSNATASFETCRSSYFFALPPPPFTDAAEYPRRQNRRQSPTGPGRKHSDLAGGEEALHSARSPAGSAGRQPVSSLHKNTTTTTVNSSNRAFTSQNSDSESMTTKKKKEPQPTIPSPNRTRATSPKPATRRVSRTTTRTKCSPPRGHIERKEQRDRQRDDEQRRKGFTCYAD